MTLHLEDIASLDLTVARQLIPSWLGGFVEAPPEVHARFVARIEAALAETTDDELRDMLRAFAEAGSDYVLYPASTAARRLSRRCMGTLLISADLVGVEHLRAAFESGPTLMLSNHLSYVDTQLTDLCLASSGEEDIADAIVAVAGPKVYGTAFRRMAASCLTTLKTAQSTSLLHNEAGLTPREVGRIALQTIAESGELMRQGRPILIYAEGSRTRTGQLQPFLRAVARYAGLPGVRIIPVAISGTDAIFPVGAEVMRPGPIQLAFGEPVVAAEYGAREAVEEAWRRVAALLPEGYRPTDETPPIA